MISCTTDTLTPSQIKHAPVSKLIYLQNEVIVLFSSSPSPPFFSIHISVYTQRPGSEERPGHREQHHEDRRLRPGQGCPQHRLL